MGLPLISVDAIKDTVIPTSAASSHFDTRYEAIAKTATSLIAQYCRIGSFDRAEYTEFVNSRKSYGPGWAGVDEWTQGERLQVHNKRYRLKNALLTDDDVDLRYDPARLYPDTSLMVEGTHFEIDRKFGTFETLGLTAEAHRGFRIVYIAGYAPNAEDTALEGVPDDLVYACGLLVKSLFDKVQTGAVSNSDDKKAATKGRESALPTEVVDMLVPYRRSFSLGSG